MTGANTDIDLAVMDSAALENPAPYYRRVLDERPFHDAEAGLWVVSRHADVRAILRDTVSYSNAMTLFPIYPLCDEAMAVLGSLADVPATTAGGDGEVHDRAHVAIRATFPTSLPRAQTTMGRIVQQRVDELVAALPGHVDASGAVDLIHHFAWELPLAIICDVLGFPPDRYEHIKQCSLDQIALTWGRLPADRQVTCAISLRSLWQECQALVETRRADPRQDMTTALIADGRLSDDEVASVVLNFAVAGHETTANAIGNALYHLLSDRVDIWRALGDDTARLADVVEEELRLHPPIIGWTRLATSEVTVSGQLIPAGARILLLLGAANRDARHFPDPDSFRPARHNDHLSFGLGAHYCVGAPLARLEMAAALGTLARTFPDARLAKGFGRRADKRLFNIGFWALEDLPIALGRPPS